MKPRHPPIPRHIAIILDGNGRWARQRGTGAHLRPRRGGQTPSGRASEGCGELGVEFLTLYAFSQENWQRPKAEVSRR